jgi:uncharacterized RDD family membrane protein YckC
MRATTSKLNLLMTVAQNVHYVGFWKRVLSKLIDIVLLGSITYLVQRSNPGMANDDQLGQISAYISLACFYYAVSWWKFSGTLGNYFFGQRVVNGQFENPTPKEVIVRVVVVLLSECVFSLPFLTVAFDPKKQGLHDKAAGTFVVEAASLTNNLT